MALEEREVEIPLTLGMSTKPSAELQQPDSMRLVENLHWRGLGELEQRPANGVDHEVSFTGDPYPETESCGLVVREDDVVVVTGDHGVMTYSEVTESEQWARRPVAASDDPLLLRFCPVSYDVSRRFIESAQFGKNSLGIYGLAAAQHNGIQVIAWQEFSESAATLKLKAIESATGKVVATTEIVSNVSIGIQACEYTEPGKEGVLVAYLEDFTPPADIKTVRYDAATNTFVTDGTLATDAGSSQFCVVKNGNRIYFGYHQHSTNVLIVQDRTIDTVWSTHTANHAAAAGMYVVVGDSRALIVSATSTTAYAEVFGSPNSVLTLLTASDETFLGITAAREQRPNSSTTNNAVAFVNAVCTSAPTGTRVRAREVYFDGAAPGALGERNEPHVWAVAHAFTLQGAAHVTLAAFIYSTPYGTSPAVPSSCFLARWRSNDSSWVGTPATAPRLDAVAKICHDRFFAFDGVSIMASVHVDADHTAWIALTADPPPHTVDIGLSTALPQTVFLERISARRPMPMPYAAPERGVVLVAGGLPWTYDGNAPVEAAPLVRPRIKVEAVSVESDGALHGTYSFIALYRWVDKAGRLHVMPGDAVTWENPDEGYYQLDVYVSVCPLTALGPEAGEILEPELYITENGGDEYFLAGDDSLNRDKLTYTEITSDGLWFKFEVTRPGNPLNPPWPFAANDDGLTPIEPEPLPPFLHMDRVVDRMWGVDAEDRSRLWFSKPLVSGYGVEWSIVNTLTVGDECTAVVDVAGVPTVLARGGIYQIPGPGPDAFGVNNFSPAVKLPGAVDCIDPVSVCRTPIGVVFRGRRGFYVLGPQGAQPFGVPIDPEVLTDPDLDPGAGGSRMRVVYQEQTNELQISGLPDGARLVYNLLEQKWSRYSVAEGSTVQDVAVARGKLWRLEHDGSAARLISERLYSQDGAEYNVQYGTWTIETPWLRPDDVLGSIRMWRAWFAFALPSDPWGIANIAITYYTDWDEVNGLTRTYRSLAAFGADRVAKLKFWPKPQICSAFKFRIVGTMYSETSSARPLALRIRFGARPWRGKRLTRPVLPS